MPTRFLRLLLPLLLVLLASPLAANTEERRWTLADGQNLRAELVSYDEAAGRVTLRLPDASLRTLPIDDFAAVDRAWLVEWLVVQEDLERILAKLGGRFEHLVTAGERPIDLHVYYPSHYNASSPRLPALLLFSPSDRAAGLAKRHLEAAEAARLVLVGCGSFRNTATDAEDAEADARFAEALPQILGRVHLDPSRVFLGGSSGGAMRAYQYAVKFPRPWAGVYAAGGWLGGPRFHDLPYPGGMRIVMVNGNLDQAANHHVEADGAVLRRAGNAVGVIAFEGGHQIPPVHSQLMAFRWLLGLEEPAEPAGP